MRGKSFILWLVLRNGTDLLYATNCVSLAGLAKGWAPTFIGYSMQGICKFGFYEVFKIFYGNLIGEVSSTGFLSAATTVLYNKTIYLWAYVRRRSPISIEPLSIWLPAPVPNFSQTSLSAPWKPSRSVSKLSQDGRLHSARDSPSSWRMRESAVCLSVKVFLRFLQFHCFSNAGLFQDCTKDWCHSGLARSPTPWWSSPASREQSRLSTNTLCQSRELTALNQSNLESPSSPVCHPNCASSCSLPVKCVTETAADFLPSHSSARLHRWSFLCYCLSPCWYYRL